MNSQKWVRSSLSILGLLIFCMMLFNYVMDPFWIFNNFYTKYKNEYNERMQKTNLLVNNKINFDGILLGSSRSTALNIKQYDNYKIFNYAVSSLNPHEYEGYINIAKTVKKDNLKVIILGLDFFSYINEQKTLIEPEKYFNDASSISYRLKTLLSYDTFKKAKKNINVKLNPGERYYKSDYSIATPFRSPEIVLKKVELSANSYSQGNYKKGLKAIREYKEIFKSIINNNKNSKIVVYTTPVTKELLRVIINNNLYDIYELWLKELVDIFGEINHFMYLNEITENYTKNFYDGHHYYTFIGDIMIDKINNKNIDLDFGIKITSDNLDDILYKLHAKHTKEL